MSQFGGTAIQALQQGAQTQQGQAAQISDTQGLAQQAAAQRGQVAGQATSTAVQGLAAAGRTQQAGISSLQQGAQSVQGAFSQLFQAKFQRDMERERADRNFRLEDSRKKTAELNDSKRIRGILQARIQISGSESGIRASRVQQLEDDLKRTTGKEERESLLNLIDTFKSQNAFDLSLNEVLLEDFRLNEIDVINDVPGARGRAHSLTGRFVIGSEATSQINPGQAAAIQAREGYGIKKANEATERLRKHELTVGRHVQLGIVSDMSSIADSLKKGKLSDVQLAQKLMTAPGVPQIARLSDIINFSIGGEGTREDREEQLDQFQKLADSGQLDVSTIRGIIGGLDSLLELGGDSLVAAAGETDMDPEDRQQLMKVAFELRRSLAAVEISTVGVSQGIKRDRVDIWRQALLNGHPASVETEVKVFKALDNAQTLAPDIIKMLTTGNEKSKAAAVSFITESAGLGPSGEQGGDLLKAALDATKQVGGAARKDFLKGVSPQELTETELQSGMGEATSLLPGSSKIPLVRGLEVAAGVAGGPVIGGLGTLLETGTSRLLGESEDGGPPSKKTRQQKLNEFTKGARARRLANTSANTTRGKNLLSEVAQEAFQEGLLSRRAMETLGAAIDAGQLTGRALLGILKGDPPLSRIARQQARGLR